MTTLAGPPQRLEEMEAGVILYDDIKPTCHPLLNKAKKKAKNNHDSGQILAFQVVGKCMKHIESALVLMQLAFPLFEFDASVRSDDIEHDANNGIVWTRSIQTNCKSSKKLFQSVKNYWKNLNTLPYKWSCLGCTRTRIESIEGTTLYHMIISLPVYLPLAQIHTPYDSDVSESDSAYPKSKKRKPPANEEDDSDNSDNLKFKKKKSKKEYDSNDFEYEKKKSTKEDDSDDSDDLDEKRESV